MSASVRPFAANHSYAGSLARRVFKEWQQAGQKTLTAAPAGVVGGSVQSAAARRRGSETLSRQLCVGGDTSCTVLSDAPPRNRHIR